MPTMTNDELVEAIKVADERYREKAGLMGIEDLWRGHLTALLTIQSIRASLKRETEAKQ